MLFHIYTDMHTDSIVYLQVWKIMELFAVCGIQKHEQLLPTYAITFDIWVQLLFSCDEKNVRAIRSDSVQISSI